MNKIVFDENAQPSPQIHRVNNKIKAINTLYGIIMGITVDQIVTDDEIYFLKLWLLDNEIHTTEFPLNVIKRRINEILADNIITQEEREDLYQTLTQIIGGSYHQTGAASGSSTAYNLEEPDSIIIYNATFCMTGAFISGPREKCQKSLSRFGGKPTNTVSKKLDYLIIGGLASRDWIATGHGTKIQKAFCYKEKGVPITIISEETLVKFIAL